MRDIGLWRWTAVGLGVAILPQLRRVGRVRFVLVVDRCYVRSEVSLDVECDGLDGCATAP
jgi:hypothetical protein